MDHVLRNYIERPSDREANHGNNTRSIILSAGLRVRAPR